MFNSCHINLNKAYLTVSAAALIFSFFYSCGRNDTQELTKEKQDSLQNKLKTSPYTGTKVFFCEDVQDDRPIGTSTSFNIIGGRRNITIGVNLKPSGKKIGSGKIDMRLLIKKDGSEKLLETLSFDVNPEWDMMYFKDVIFYQPGNHKVIVLKPDGTPVATGEFEIKGQ